MLARKLSILLWILAGNVGSPMAVAKEKLLMDKYVSPDGRLAVELTDLQSKELGIMATVRDLKSGERKQLYLFNELPPQKFLFFDDNRIIVVVWGGLSAGTYIDLFRRRKGISFDPDEKIRRDPEFHGLQNEARFHVLQNARIIPKSWESNHIYTGVDGFLPPSTLLVSLWGDALDKHHSERLFFGPKTGALDIKTNQFIPSSHKTRGSDWNPQMYYQDIKEYGTGFFVSPDGYFVTCNHVVEKAELVKIIASNGEACEATAIRVDADHDIALFKTNLTAPAVCGLCQSFPIETGEKVSTFGFQYPQKSQFNAILQTGNLSSLTGLGDESQFTTSIPISEGSSGSPVWREGGEVLGMILSNIDPKLVKEKYKGERFTFAVKAEYIQKLLSQAGRKPPPVPKYSSPEAATRNLKASVVRVRVYSSQ